ncbi:MAG TPA: 1,4-alpha-glucan branching protein domain-containing protein, partial [Gemmatimonadales bacterium]|nr:1,4-alpha-glucan branching protein domain-containing protein [Gemmatimonadales bacterium]
LAAAGRPLGLYGDPHLAPPVTQEGVEREPLRTMRTPYRAYRVAPSRAGNGLAAYVRDPRASMQVWSRHEGYPGEARYLEFHKIRWPGGLKLWRVTGGDVDLGAKAPYEPALARESAEGHAHHFAGLLQGLSRDDSPGPDGVIVAPFDTELFGHWWFEGPYFLGQVYRTLTGCAEVRPVTGSRHLADHPARVAIRLPAGTWGANGDFSMWLNDRTAWTWQRLWPLEEAFWNVAGDALADPAARHVLEQAARQMLLAQSSDWQFIISTGAVVDYAERRFRLHCDDADRLVAALTPGSGVSLDEGRTLADALDRRDPLFPGLLPAVAAALAGSRSIAVS